MSYPTVNWSSLRQELRSLMCRRARTLASHRLYELPDITGQDWWNQFSGKQQRRIGQIGASLVRKKEVPYTKYKDSTSDRHAQYFIAVHDAGA